MPHVALVIAATLIILDTGAVVAVILREADKGDTTAFDRKMCEAGETAARLVGREPEYLSRLVPTVNLAGIGEMVGHKS